jgi:hypothetical protein
MYLYLHLQLSPLLLGQPLEFGLIPDHLKEEFIIFIGLGFLFVIIGVIFFIKLFSSIYISVFEKKGVIKSLLKSRELVANNFWKVLWRVFVLGLTIMIIGFLFRFTLILAGINLTIIDIISYIFTWFIIPFCLIYGFLIYKDLQEVKTEKPRWDFSKKKKTGYITIGIYIITGIFGLLIGLLCLGMMANLIYRADDEPPHNDRDLWLAKIEIPIQDNAFYDLAPYIISQFEKEWLLEHWPEKEKQALKEIEFKEVYLPEFKKERALIDNILKGDEWDKEFASYILKKMNNF